MVLASPSSGDHVHSKFEYKTIQIGQSGVAFGAFCWRRQPGKIKLAHASRKEERVVKALRFEKA
jgi:hypothetical protein